MLHKEFFEINIKYIQGDHSGCAKPQIDIDLKLHLSIRTLYHARVQDAKQDIEEKQTTAELLA